MAIMGYGGSGVQSNQAQSFHAQSQYDKAQSALGCPISETLQVDESINSLGEVMEYHIETVRALLRRLHPVTGDLCDAKCASTDPTLCRVPLAQRISNRRDELHELTTEVQNVIRALQI